MEVFLELPSHFVASHPLAYSGSDMFHALWAELRRKLSSVLFLRGEEGIFSRDGELR